MKRRRGLGSFMLAERRTQRLWVHSRQVLHGCGAHGDSAVIRVQAVHDHVPAPRHELLNFADCLHELRIQLAVRRTSVSFDNL